MQIWNEMPFVLLKYMVLKSKCYRITPSPLDITITLTSLWVQTTAVGGIVERYSLLSSMYADSLTGLTINCMRYEQINSDFTHTMIEEIILCCTELHMYSRRLLLQCNIQQPPFTE